jgi:hypothetical protein
MHPFASKFSVKWVRLRRKKEDEEFLNAYHSQRTTKSSTKLVVLVCTFDIDSPFCQLTSSFMSDWACDIGMVKYKESGRLVAPILSIHELKIRSPGFWESKIRNMNLIIYLS